jgi:hypothetical protein
MPHSVNQCPNVITNPLEQLASCCFEQMFSNKAQHSENAPRPFVKAGDRWEIEVMKSSLSPDVWTVQASLWRKDETGVASLACLIRNTLDASEICPCEASAS